MPHNVNSVIVLMLENRSFDEMNVTGFRRRVSDRDVVALLGE